MADWENSLKYKDKVVIISGGSRGIGEGCVRVFVKNGATVAFCGLEVDLGEKLESEMNEKGPGKSFFKPADVSKEEAIKVFIEEVVNRYSRIDCLINNAGTHPPVQYIDEISADEFKDLLNINLISYFLMSKEGAIPYAASKGAIEAMTKSMAIDEASHHVRVNGISLGNFWTPLWENLARAHGDACESLIEAGCNAQLMGRMGKIEEAGQACFWLATDATYCTGSIILVTGGAELDFGDKNRTMARDSLYV